MTRFVLRPDLAQSKINGGRDIVCSPHRDEETNEGKSTLSPRIGVFIRE